MTASNVICIGTDVAGANVDNSCFVGNIYQNQVGADSLPVEVDSLGKLGTAVSSKRFNRDIKPMGHGSAAVLALKPVTFHNKSDKINTPQFGLVAEEVAEINPELVVRDKEGNPYTVRNDAVNAMLLNEFLKEHRKKEQQEETIAQLKSRVAKQQAIAARQQEKIKDLARQLKEQGTQNQRVSAQVGLSKPSSQIVSE